jgi:hypothetical protein
LSRNALSAKAEKIPRILSIEWKEEGGERGQEIHCFACHRRKRRKVMPRRGSRSDPEGDDTLERTRRLVEIVRNKADAVRRKAQEVRRETERAQRQTAAARRRADEARARTAETRGKARDLQNEAAERRDESGDDPPQR